MKTLRSTFAILFYLNRAKTKKNGLCPLMGRITIDTGIAQFSAKIDVNPDLWDGKAGRATGKSKQSIEVNRYIDKLEQSIKDSYGRIVSEEGYVTAERVKNALNGVGEKKDTLLKLLEEHNEEFAKRVGVNRVYDTYTSYLGAYKHLARFIKGYYNMVDIPLRSLDHSFIDNYDFYLRVDRKMKPATVLSQIIPLRKMIRRAINQGILKRDPFVNYVAEQPEKQRRHLTREELDKFMSAKVQSKQVTHTQDMFIFSSFTGLAYADICNLSEKHIRTEADGTIWIHIHRQKTGGESNIMLLDIPKQIMEKYHSERKGDKIFNMVTLTCIGRNLNVVAASCGITRRITFHMGRHNFATHITLSQGVPMETVCRIMGHKSVQTTQIYAKITNQKVNEDMKLLAERIGTKYELKEAIIPMFKHNQYYK